MAVSRQVFDDEIGVAGTIHEVSDLEETAEVLSIQSVTINYVVIVNAGAEIDYVKFYNSAAPTVGTTDPRMILPVGNAKTVVYVWPDGLSSVFTTALSVACVSEAGTAGTTTPVGTVNVLVGLA